MLCIQKGRTWSWSRSARHGVVRSSWLALFRTWMNSRGWYMSIARSFLRNGTIFVGLFLRSNAENGSHYFVHGRVCGADVCLSVARSLFQKSPVVVGLFL